MKVVYADQHREHAPRREFAEQAFSAYPEVPERAENILRTLTAGGLFEVIPPREYGRHHLLTAHDGGYLDYLEEIYPVWVRAGLNPEAVAPAVFAVGKDVRRPGSPLAQVGYYGYDTTPIVEGTFTAAVAAAGCAPTAADLLTEGERAVYALCRPPGHHAGRRSCGGYCYLNNAAIAAAHLSGRGKVAILDIDFHHGNGTQEIFYDSGQVLFVSLHADPDRHFPFFWGRTDEQGAGPGLGCNRNLPLPAGIDDDRYLQVLDQALETIARFAPAFLVVSAGFDTCAGDPLGDFAISLDGFGRIGEHLATTGYPSLLVQEGGYDLDHLGEAVGGLLSAF